MRPHAHPPAARPGALRAWALLWLLLTLAGWVSAQTFGFAPPRSVDDVAAAAAVRDLAQRLVPVYQEADTELYLRNLTAMQIVTGAYAAAADTSRKRSERSERTDRRPGPPTDGQVESSALADGLYARARGLEATEHLAFVAAYRRAFEETLASMGDAQAAALMARLQRPLAAYRAPVQQAFDRWRAPGSMPLADAVALIRAYVAYESRRSYGALLPPLVAAENARRYVADADLPIPLGRGLVIHASVVRPARTQAPLPTLLRFTLDPAEDDARRSAAQGYIGITAYVRGRKPDGSGAVRPFVHDGDDARAVIDWIARQPWSDGRVAMVGEGYSGYTAWAAARRAPAALKAIATIAPMAPGIDFPMAGQIYRNAMVPWAQQQTATSAAATARPPASDLQALNQAWYRQGGPYQDIDLALLGRRNPLVQTWLAHPSHDRYWRKFLPTDPQFAQIDVPVLTIAGYYGAEAGALYYQRQHLRQRPGADHTLLAGPYDATSVRSGTAASLRGLALDAAAQVDLPALRQAWLDHKLKGAKPPQLLPDRVNLEVMGANAWRHAPALDTASASAQPLRLWFGTPGAAGAPHRLSASKETGEVPVQLTVNLADRSDAQAPWPDTVFGAPPPTRNGVRFVSDPLTEDTDIAGSMRGVFDFTPSAQDMDLSVALYEQTAHGDHLLLFEPYDFRASYAGDRVHRRLLQAGVRQSLAFTTERLTARRLRAGSRLVLVLAVNKRADRQVNHGGGQAVNAETTADAEVPLRLRWHAGSHIEIDARKP